MTDRYGDSVDWTEDFVCEDGQCLKSNFGMFGQSKAYQLFYTIDNSVLFPVTEINSSSNYKKIFLQPEFSPNPKHPVSVLIDIKDISSDTFQVDWYRKLSELKKVVEQESASETKLEKIRGQVKRIYTEWGENVVITPYFDSFTFDAHFFLLSLLAGC